jgi:serine/threonine protein kinase
MSPEQSQGKEVDARSDLFSFGCVLYEMLTGKWAFEGSAASVIAAILVREPAPLEVARPLDRGDPASVGEGPGPKIQTARDLKAALSWALEQPPQINTPPRPPRLGGGKYGGTGDHGDDGGSGLVARDAAGRASSHAAER